MVVIAANDTDVSATLTSHEVLILCNALNEVCHGLHIEAFSVTIGAERTAVEYLHESLLAVGAAQEAAEHAQTEE